MQQQIQACNAELAAAQAELARAQAALAKLGSGLRPSNWFRSDASTAAKQSREEAAIAQANAGIARAQARLAELHASLHQAQQEEAALGSQVPRCLDVAIGTGGSTHHPRQSLAPPENQPIPACACGTLAILTPPSDPPGPA